MARKNENIDIEEILLREVAGRYEVRDPMPPSQEPNRQSDERTPRAQATSPRKAARYEDVFLRENPVRERSVIYVSAETKRKLAQVAHRLGWSRISITAFADNILSNHLEVFRDEINRLHKLKNTKDII